MTAPEGDERQLDIATMREGANQVLANNAPLPNWDDLHTITLQLRGHLMLLVPEIEDLTGRLPDDAVPRTVARAGAGEARRRLDEMPGPNLPRAVAHAQRLARSVEALCTHLERLAVPR
jgi:uncharacterized protein DUF6415